MKKIGARQVSEAQISRFENEESELTIGKFFFLLNNMGVGLDEFESVYEAYNLSDEYKFRQELIEAFDAKDAPKLRKMYVDWERKTQKYPDNLYYQLTTTVVKVILNLVVKNITFTPEEVERVQEYLIGVDNWGRYEFWLFTNTTTIFKESTLSKLGAIAMGKTEFYQVLPVNKRLTIRCFHNLAHAALEGGNPSLAMKYINHLDKMDLPIDYLYEKL